MAEFKIARLRFNWAGVWETTTVYNRDAITQHEGKMYVCLVPHTSGDFYQDLTYVTPGGAPQPYWEVVAEGSTWKGPWEPSTRYSLSNIVTYGGSVYYCISDHTSALTFNNAKWTLYTEFSKWNNNWETDVPYGIGDVVKYGGIVYICNTNHKSAASTSLGLEDHIGFWTVLYSGIDFKGTWQGSTPGPATRYKLNDVVKNGPDLWICVSGHLASSTFNPIKWNTWLPGIEYQSSWSALETYQPGDVVSYGGYSYVSTLINNINHTPSIDAVNWTLLTQGFNVKIVDWAQSYGYKVGDTVHKGGYLYVAIADNAQDPSDYTVTKTYTAAGSSGTTLKVNNTTSIAVGMTIIGTGFTDFYTVVEVTNNTTLKISAAPDTTLSNGQSITFAGVNSAYWTLVSSSMLWRNRWGSSNTYSIGDVVVWKNGTYICKQDHLANSGNRPDADTQRSYWSVYVTHARKNALAELGDIEIGNNNGTYSAVNIGTQDYTLRATSNVPTWKYINTITNVYYVSTAGTDGDVANGWGLTWDKPFKTIKYATDIVAAGTVFQDAGALIRENKSWMIREMLQYMQYQVDYNISPYTSPNNVYDAAKTARDAEFVIDAIVYDMTRVGNSQIVSSTLAYFSYENPKAFINATVTQQMPIFINSLTFLKGLIANALNEVAPGTDYQFLTSYLPYVPQVIDAGLTAEGGSVTTAQALIDILLTALSTQSLDQVPSRNQGTTATIFVKTGTYGEELPITVPENTAIVGDELRSVTVTPKTRVSSIVISTSASTKKFTVYSTNGMVNNSPVQFVGTPGGVIRGQTYYVIGTSIGPTSFSVSETIDGTAKDLTSQAFLTVSVYGGDALKDMFYVRNGTGLRNVTVTGLLGVIGDPNQYSTKRPTGGSYVSLDPGEGPDDTTAWIFKRSPYIQNVTTFGDGCIGLKIDGTLHNGGLKSVTANDFTQVISNGIGVWCTGTGSLTELVSVFAYYGYAGYMAEDGGRIRATNGNTSYGTFGVIAEGFDDTENPITGNVFNTSTQVQAQVQSSLGVNSQVVSLQFSNNGSGYYTSTTNLLKYTNNLLGANWSTDNLTLAKNTLAPTGNTEAWTLTGTSSTASTGYIYQNITVPTAGKVYTQLSAVNVTGSGSLATFNVTVTNTTYVISVYFGGSGYVGGGLGLGNQLVISGSQLGGTSPENDCNFTVDSLSGSTILTVIPDPANVVPAGSAFPYTVSAYVKQGTSANIDLYANFSGYSSQTSSISFNFSTGTITPSSTLGGYTPTQYGKITLTNGWYRLWFSTNDTSGLNNQLQYRIYAKGISGLSGLYSYVYGNQVEFSQSTYTPSFYYENTDTTSWTSYANYNIQGAGTGAVAIGDEIRSGSVFQTRITDTGTGAGGSGYLTSSNNAQIGNTKTITLSGADVNTDANYKGMRLFINSGTGSGQYGYISYFDYSTKTATILKESFENKAIVSTVNTGSWINLSGTTTTENLYTGQPVQFIPTYYTSSITGTSLSQVSVTQTQGGIVNQLTVADTSAMTVNMAISFTSSFSTIITGQTYFINEIVDGTTIKITNQIYSSEVWPLSPSGITTVSSTLNYPANNGYLSGLTSNMAVNLPISFTGSSMGGLSIATVYYINEIYGPGTFSVSNSLVTVAASNTTAITNVITVAAGTASTLNPLYPIVFSGFTGTFGNLVSGYKYYVSKIIDSSNFTVVQTLVEAFVTATEAGSNLITVSNTTGFLANNPIRLIGTAFGGITSDQCYYIQSINGSAGTATQITISVSPGGQAIQLTDATGRMNLRTSSDPFTLDTASGTATGTSTSTKISLTSSSANSMNGTFSTPLFGNVDGTAIYYVDTIDSGGNRIKVTATSGSGVPITVSNATGDMNLAAVGWDHVASGTPIVNTLDTSSLYYIEPRTTYTAPPFSQTAATGEITLALGTNWTSMAYSEDGYWIALPSGNTTAARSTDGNTWSSVTLPSNSSWSSIAYGNKHFVAVATGQAAIYSNSNGIGWRPATLPVSTTWSEVVYGEGVFVTISTNSTNSAYSLDYGVTWSAGTGLPSAAWTALAYGNGLFLAVAGGGTQAATSPDGITWTSRTLPSSTTWTGVAYGTGKFVAISSTSNKSAYSFDGITWYESTILISGTSICYGQGVFLVLDSTSTTAYTSEDGFNWKKRTVTNDGYNCCAFGFTQSSHTGVFATLAGRNVGSLINAGSRTKGRAVITSGVITSIVEWEPGSNYTVAPTVTFTDPNVTTLATVSPRLSNGTLGNPSLITKGTGYNNTSTTVAITGNGYANQYQTGLGIIVNNLTKLPQPGDNLVIAGVDQIYKVTSSTAVYGTTAPNIEANVQISPEMSVALSPEDGAAVTIRQKYSQVRLTGHDFLNVGFGTLLESNYPGVPTDTILAKQDQAVEVNYGRVFYTSTDQDGNFNVGGLFGVEQATGIVTLSASQFGLSGLSQLSLGGIAVGGNSVVVTQFSTDASFVANADTIIPTQKAIKSYLASRLSQGGSNTFTGQLTAGSVVVGGPDKISNTTPEGTVGSSIKIGVRMNFAGVGGAVDGDLAAFDFFMKGASRRGNS